MIKMSDDGDSSLHVFVAHSSVCNEGEVFFIDVDPLHVCTLALKVLLMWQSVIWYFKYLT